MIRLIEASRFRCLRHVRQPLGPLHVLVGPNASGKTTFLDVIAFLGRLVSDGLDAAVGAWTDNFQDLVWNREGDSFELAIEAQIPQERLELLPDKSFKLVRYEVGVGLHEETREVAILNEAVLLKPDDLWAFMPRSLGSTEYPHSIVRSHQRGTSPVLGKMAFDGSDYYSAEVFSSGVDVFKHPPAWSSRLGPRKSALGHLIEDETTFPAATWLKRLLTQGVQSFVLNSLLMRRPSPPGHPRAFKPDGSNLPWVVDHLERKDPQRFQDWISHLRTALPDLEGIRTVERPEDRHRYLMLRYAGGLEVPSWVVSDGTLRLLALTLPAYLADFSGVYLIEEPENGIHPRAVETVFQSLSSVYDAQLLLATHSPVVLSVASPEQVLCFSKNADGATEIVSGDQHPALRQWRGDPNLGVLFAGGVLG